MNETTFCNNDTAVNTLQNNADKVKSPKEHFDVLEEEVDGDEEEKKMNENTS